MRVCKTLLVIGMALSLIVVLLCSQTTFVSAADFGLEVNSINDSDSGAVLNYGDNEEDDADGEEGKDDEDGRQDHEGYADDGDIAKQGGYASPSFSPSSNQKRKKVSVLVFVPEKEKKKMKVLSVEKGFYVQGGTQLFGKFKSLKHCMKACAVDPTCFEGDFNPWLHKCYKHTNTTACGRQRGHHQSVHFSKVPCVVTDAPRGRITLGASMINGIEVSGAINLRHCIKKCTNAGRGIVSSLTTDGKQFALQACFGIDYDFASHKCFVFGANLLQWSPGLNAFGSTYGAPPPPVVWTQCNAGPGTALANAQGLIPNPTVVHITFCPNLAG